MTRLHRSSLIAAGLVLMAGGLTGCQTQIAGMTLPSGYYLQHRPQYFPTEPNFPLGRELATMQAQNQAAAAAEAGVAVPLPGPVVPPAAAPAPVPAAPVVPGAMPR